MGDSESIVDLSVSPRPRAKTQWGNEMHNPTNKGSSSLYDTASPAGHANAVEEDGAEAAGSQAVYSFAAATGNNDDFDASVSVGSAIYSLTTNTNDAEQNETQL